jgi:protein SCO1/2
MRRTRTTAVFVLLAALLSSAAFAQQRYQVKGLVLSVDRPHLTMVVSCDEVHGYMDAMVMPFKVLDAKLLDGLARGALVEFTLIVNRESSYVESVQVRKYASAEREPAKARRLGVLDEALQSAGSQRLAAGEAVPDFAMTDQKNRAVHFGQFAGKVVALNFVYTRCTLPDYCFRLSNNFGVLQKRYKDRMGRDLILLTITFDPVHDQPELLSSYAQTWKADPETWRFLTGRPQDVQRVCDLFGVNFVPDEGLFIHSLHTAVIGRDGKLVANLEGNEFTAEQLGDLVGTELDHPK